MGGLQLAFLQQFIALSRNIWSPSLTRRPGVGSASLKEVLTLRGLCGGGVHKQGPPVQTSTYYNPKYTVSQARALNVLEATARMLDGYGIQSKLVLPWYRAPKVCFCYSCYMAPARHPKNCCVRCAPGASLGQRGWRSLYQSVRIVPQNCP